MTTTPDVVHKPFPAQPRFSGLVERVLSSVADDRGRLDIPVPPTGAIYLNAMTRGRTVFEFPGSPEQQAPVLYFGGQLVKAMPLARVETPWTLVGLQFSPTGFRRLFRLDASVLTDRMLPMEKVAPEMARTLEAALHSSMAPERVATRLQDAIGELLPEVDPPGLAERAVARIEKHKGRIDMSELAASCGVTPRHLRRVFARDVGLSPKSFAKTVQLREIISVLHAQKPGAMHDVALAHGYYDQSHFVRDFTRLVGNNPSAFMSSRDLFLDMFLSRKKRP